MLPVTGKRKSLESQPPSKVQKLTHRTAEISQTPGPSGIASLPGEILAHIFSFLGPQSIFLRVAHVCRDWRTVVDFPPDVLAIASTLLQGIKEEQVTPIADRLWEITKAILDNGRDNEDTLAIKKGGILTIFGFLFDYADHLLVLGIDPSVDYVSCIASVIKNLLAKKDDKFLNIINLRPKCFVDLLCEMRAKDCENVDALIALALIAINDSFTQSTKDDATSRIDEWYRNYVKLHHLPSLNNGNLSIEDTAALLSTRTRYRNQQTTFFQNMYDLYHSKVNYDECLCNSLHEFLIQHIPPLQHVCSSVSDPDY